MLRPFRQFADGFGHRRGFFLQHAEHGALAALAVLDDAGGAGERAVNLREQRGARFLEGIARAGFDERFEHLAVHGAAVHALAHVGQAT